MYLLLCNIYKLLRHTYTRGPYYYRPKKNFYENYPAVYEILANKKALKKFWIGERGEHLVITLVNRILGPRRFGGVLGFIAFSQ